jgi:hypothetical protein
MELALRGAGRRRNPALLFLFVASQKLRCFARNDEDGIRHAFTLDHCAA